jgi:membrane protein
LILLTGASIAFYHQNPNYLARERRSLALSPRMRERVALRLMRRVAGAYYAGRGGVGSEEVAAELNLPLDPVEDVVEALLGAGMLSQTGTEPPRLLPGRPPDETPIKALLDAVRSAREDDLVAPARLPAEPALDALEQALEEAADGALAGRTLKDLLVSADASGVEAQPPVERLGGD